MDIKENTKNTDVWSRGLFILIYGVIFYFLLFLLIMLVVVFQFLIKLITGELNKPLLDFSDSLIRYVSQILLYITFKSEECPFPFSPWPHGKQSDEPAAMIQKRITRKKTSKKKTVRKDSAEDNGS